MLLSLFCGAGGLDLGFEQAGFEIAMACDIREDSVASYNHNRQGTPAAVGRVQDVRELTLEKLDELLGPNFQPSGIIGGPPCQSFSRANKAQSEDDPRHELPFIYADLIGQLNKRHPVPFFAFENVTGLHEEPHRERFAKLKTALDKAGFAVAETVMNASQYGVPQNRQRVILVGLNKKLFPRRQWVPPMPNLGERLTVRDAIAGLPEPTHFRKNLAPTDIAHHPNHWCMAPKSPRFTLGLLREGDTSNRSFKTLAWDRPSITVAYGNREVHVHPSGRRRLSVYEAMLLQGFPLDYELLGNLSSQITQISEAVPPPMAFAIARSIQEQIDARFFQPEFALVAA